MSSALNIIEVLENLTTLVDAKSLDEIEVTSDDRLIPHKIIQKTDETINQEEEGDVYWMHAGSDDQTLKAIKHTFRSVHTYLRHSFDKVKGGQDPKRFIEGIGTIMVLVGEAAKKLEKLGVIFKDKVSDLDEYRQLQDFYQNTVVKGSFSHLAKDIYLKEKRERKKEREEEPEEVAAGVHILNNIDLIKGDLLYELFYLKNEEGHHFYTHELARNIKLACDFGEFSKEYFSNDPLLQIKNWEDKNLQLFATYILHHSKNKIRKFYSEALHFKNVSFVILMNNALMALMLASNTRNLIRQFSPKGSHRYFADFQHFLREILQSREYQRELLYPSQKEPFFVNAAELTRELCHHLFASGVANQELKEGLITLSKLENIKKGAKLSEILLASYQNLASSFKRHPSGPVFKSLDLLYQDEVPIFDPLMQGNLPEVEAHIKENEHEISLLRLACPTMQEIISKAYIVDEFKEYLRSVLNKKGDYHHLIINYQDNTSWKEHARSSVLEELGNQAEFSNILTIITLSKDSDFYHQSGPYRELSSGESFLKHFKEHLMDENTGYYFPQKIREILFDGFIDKLFVEIYKTFFKNHDILSLQERQSFIEIAYGFIELKLIEETQCSYLCLTSKDGLDVSATASTALLVLIKLADNKKLTQKEIEQVLYILFGQTMLIRERNLQPERFDRLLQFIMLLEKTDEYLVPFKTLFKSLYGATL